MLSHQLLHNGNTEIEIDASSTLQPDPTYVVTLTSNIPLRQELNQHCFVGEDPH
jgi:hypothetical protein